MTLDVQHVSKSFGGVRALIDVSLAVEAQSITGLIGPNGAGKTTLFDVISGLTSLDAGVVRLGNTVLSTSAPEGVCRAGVARTFQGLRLFAELTCVENLVVAGEVGASSTPLASLLRTHVHRTQEARVRERARALLDAFGLLGFADHRPGTLAYGDQRRLEIARALMTQPKVLLLDEPAAGMNDAETEELASRILTMREEWAVTVLLVEHNLELVLGTCDRIHVLDHGENLASGTPKQIREDARVIAAYLGEDAGEVSLPTGTAGVRSRKELVARRPMDDDPDDEDDGHG